MSNRITTYLEEEGSLLTFKGTSQKYTYLQGTNNRLPQIAPDGTLQDSTILIANLATVVALGNFIAVSTGGADSGALAGIRGRMDRPYRNIQTAISAATSGDEIWVFPGTFTENLTIPTSKRLTIKLFSVTLNGDIAYTDPVTNQVLDGTYSSTLNGRITATGSSSQKIFVVNFVEHFAYYWHQLPGNQQPGGVYHSAHAIYPKCRLSGFHQWLLLRFRLRRYTFQRRSDAKWRNLQNVRASQCEPFQVFGLIHCKGQRT